MVNNFRAIESYLDSRNLSETLVYSVKIFTRNKDNTGDRYNPLFTERVINNYLIKTSAQLERLEEEIKTLCNLYNARAYINLSPKNMYDIRNKLLMTLTQGLVNHVDANVTRDYLSAIDSTGSDYTRWVVDLDDFNYHKAVSDYFTSIGWTNEVLELPTVSGMHFITPKFNMQEFKQYFPTIDVHKNSAGTLLYYG